MKNHPIQKLTKDLPLERKVAIIQAHIEENHFGKQAIPCCMPYDGWDGEGIRPWREEDFLNQSIPKFRGNLPDEPAKITPAGWINFENSTSFSGEYLLASSLRYRVTKDPAALLSCRRALNAIRTISELAPAENFGWLCKPFGGKISPESSPDQNICAMAGLYSFLPFATTEERLWITTLIAAVASHWEKINYTIDFGDAVWDLQYDVSHMRIFLLANQLAYHLTGKINFKTVAAKLEDRYGEPVGEMVSLYDTFTNIHPGYFDDWRHTQEFAGATLLFVPLALDILCDLRPERKALYLTAWQRALKHGLMAYSPSFGGHIYNTQTKLMPEGFVWRAMNNNGPTEEQYKQIKAGAYALGVYQPEILWLDGTSRLPLAYLLYLSRGGSPMPEIEAATRSIMHNLDFRTIHWMLEMEPGKTIEELQFIFHALTSETPNYPAAYWLGKRLSFWL